MQKYVDVAWHLMGQHPVITAVLALSVTALVLMWVAAERAVKRFTRDLPEDGQ